MKRMKLLYGTGNSSKLRAMREVLSQFDIEILGLKDMPGEPPHVEEDGTTPLENARKKALHYYKAYGIPVFSCDSGLYFDNVSPEDQPGVHVRNVNGKCLTDRQMQEHYRKLAEKYGGITARYHNAVCLVLDQDHVHEAMEENMASVPFRLVSTPHPRGMEEGFPLDSISVDMETGKYYYDMGEEEQNRLVGEEGFAEFFRKFIDALDKGNPPRL